VQGIARPAVGSEDLCWAEEVTDGPDGIVPAPVCAQQKKKQTG
jgi:hypothetical protein